MPSGPENAAVPAPARELAVVLVAVLIPLVWLSDRAFNIDEPLFLWLAEQIQRDPLDFFGFAVNWYGSEQPMVAVTRNPPLTGYAIAAIASLVGSGERTLHLAFLAPAGLAAVATWEVARRLGAARVGAALLTIATPVFLVCASTVMSDVPMLALWTGAVALWLRGVEEGDRRWLYRAGALAAIAVWTKYFAIALVPLLGVYGWAAGTPVRRLVVPLLLPIAALVGLEIAMNALYGVGAIEQAMAEALHMEGISRPAPLRQLVEGLAFAGGCVAPALLLAPWLWGWTPVVVGGVAAVGLAGLAPASLGWLGLPVAEAAESAATASRWLALQLGVMALGGVSVLALGVEDMRRRRDSGRWLIGLWILGAFVFAAFLNWTNNGRSNLVLAPVVAIAITRRLADRGIPLRAPGPAIAVVLSGALALSVAWADRTWSNGVRDAASELLARHAPLAAERTLWFHGHWGLQYYLERGGAQPVDWRRDVIRPGDRLIVATNNAEVHVPSARVATAVDGLEMRVPRWIHTQAKQSGASFNASNLGPLPFLLGPAAPDRYRVFRAHREIRYERWFGWSERAAAGTPRR